MIEPTPDAVYIIIASILIEPTIEVLKIDTMALWPTVMYMNEILP